MQKPLDFECTIISYGPTPCNRRSQQCLNLFGTVQQEENGMVCNYNKSWLHEVIQFAGKRLICESSYLWVCACLTLKTAHGDAKVADFNCTTYPLVLHPVNGKVHDLHPTGLESQASLLDKCNKILGSSHVPHDPSLPRIGCSAQHQSPRGWHARIGPPWCNSAYRLCEHEFHPAIYTNTSWRPDCGKYVAFSQSILWHI